MGAVASAASLQFYSWMQLCTYENVVTSLVGSVLSPKPSDRLDSSCGICTGTLMLEHETDLGLSLFPFQGYSREHKA